MEQQPDTFGDSGQPKQLTNETIVNVAQLMKEDVGARRRYRLSLDWFTLDNDLVARNVTADLRLTRITGGILASGRVEGVALVECVRCLEIYEQPFATDFDQEYRPTIDVRSGLLVEQPSAHEELGSIDEAHELDLAEPMRQMAILDLPIKPICDEACAGVPQPSDDEADQIDRRFSVLRELLEPEDDATSE